MKTADAIAHFQAGFNRPASYRIAEALGISRQAVEQWGDLVPLKSALRLEQITRGKLKANTAEYVEAGAR